MKIKKWRSTPNLSQRGNNHNINIKHDDNDINIDAKNSRQRSNTVNESQKIQNEVQSRLISIISNKTSKYNRIKKARKIKSLDQPVYLNESPIMSEEYWTPPKTESLYKPSAKIKTSKSNFSSLRKFKSNKHDDDPQQRQQCKVEINDNDILSIQRSNSTSFNITPQCTPQRTRSNTYSSFNQFKSSESLRTHEGDDAFELDVLYENQRGLFLLGTAYCEHS